MASCFTKGLEDHFFATNEAAVPKNTKIATKFDLLMLTGRKTIIFSLNLLQNLTIKIKTIKTFLPKV